MNRFRTIAITAIAGFVLVACGPAASGSESQGGAASQPASQAAQESQGGAGPSLAPGAVAELEALIPDKVGDITMTKSSYRGNEFLTAPGADASIIQFLHDVGVSPNDISIASGTGFNTDSATFAAVFVIRAAGADSNALVNAFKGALGADAASPLEWTSASVGGKQVQATAADAGGMYVYGKGDTVFWVIASDQAIAATVLSGLP